jgi:hypothetical protein
VSMGARRRAPSPLLQVELPVDLAQHLHHRVAGRRLGPPGQRPQFRRRARITAARPSHSGSTRPLPLHPSRGRSRFHSAIMGAVVKERACRQRCCRLWRPTGNETSPASSSRSFQARTTGRQRSQSYVLHFEPEGMISAWRYQQISNGVGKRPPARARGARSEGTGTAWSGRPGSRRRPRSRGSRRGRRDGARGCRTLGCSSSEPHRRCGPWLSGPGCRARVGGPLWMRFRGGRARSGGDHGPRRRPSPGARPVPTWEPGGRGPAARRGWRGLGEPPSEPPSPMTRAASAPKPRSPRPTGAGPRAHPARARASAARSRSSARSRRLRARAAARSYSAAASRSRPSSARKWPRTLGSRW